ncbi:hypothetical protein EOD39_11915 [Acipenser ruthenus]|uniref:Uncharacterized protein n=1 Tax=Acipenser ruthenus TaxID=7906 RepID=A0A662YRF7_ACIRT|nr:hypothetical protein EOD39_11915 [Acipenser ruthenus]
MSAQRVTNGVTLFTTVITTNELHHDKFAVVTFNRAILEVAASEGFIIHKLHIFSDGAGSQFKSCFTLSNLVRPEVIYKDLEEVNWSFFATAHDKGPADGVVGTVRQNGKLFGMSQLTILEIKHSLHFCLQLTMTSHCQFSIK